MSTVLRQRINNKKAKIAVIGLGYVGLPLAVNFAKAGFKVLGLDKDVDRVGKIKKKESYILDVTSVELARVVTNGQLHVSTEFSSLKSADVMIICVPTPLKHKYTPDISYIVRAVRTIGQYLRRDTLIVLESTTYPGTTEELIKPQLERGSLKAGRDFYLSFSPERIDPGNKNYDVTKIPKLVGGLTPLCGALTKLLYEKIIKEVHVLSSARAAEMTKLLENSFRIINIGWINEVAMMCHKMGIDVWEVIEAAKTKPFGFMPFYPGLGVGGHCIPDDPLYLYWKARRYGFQSKYIKLSADTNLAMPAYAVGRLKKMLGKKSLAKSKILVVGVTYKKDVKDLRKSTPLKFMELLRSRHTHVEYYDPIIPYLDIGNLGMKSVELNPKTLLAFDCVVIATDHTQIDYSLILKYAKLIFDIKNVYKNIKALKVVRL